MKIMYIDESGDTIALSQGGKKFLVLTGCIVDDSDKLEIEKSFRHIKREYYQNPEVEIKSNFLRYANPDLTEKSPIKLKDRQRYDELEEEMAVLLKEISIQLVAVVIDKKQFWKQFPAQNPYDTAYIFLIEFFQNVLREASVNGIVIIDPREGQVEKTFIGQRLDKIHSQLRWDDQGFWQQCPNIIERLLFATSDRTVGIQLADLYCYPIFHMFEYDKQEGEYWRFDEVTLPKLIEFRFFPEETKRDLRFFTDS